MGFIQLQTDKCIYVINRSIHNLSEHLILGVYVDDILCSGTTMDITSWFHKELSIYFSITINLKSVHFWGCKLIITKKIITISQPGYVATC